jgi:hypothetical protein
MEFDKTLSLVQNDHLWMDYDTSFCNRIIHWETAYHINTVLNFNYEILLDREQWPEVNFFLNLPYTSLKNDLINNIDKLDTEDYSFVDIFNLTKNISKKNDIRFNLNYQTGNATPKLIEFLNNEYLFKLRPSSLIKIKNHLVEDYIRKETKDVVGIHIRRGNGVIFNENDLNGLPEEEKKNYLNYRKKIVWGDNNYHYVKDEYYFNIINKILEINPKQKFFISTDLPYFLISYFIEKYKDNIITKESFLNNIVNYLKFTYDDVNNNKKTIVLYNCIDIFSLSYCKFIIKSDFSTWSDFAASYRNQPSVFITQSIDEIINAYKSQNFEQNGDYLLSKVKPKKNIL